MSQIHITESNGRRMNQTATSVTQNDGMHAQMRITFMPQNPQDVSPPFKLRVDVPMSFRDVEVPFSIRDLKMP